VGRVAKINLIDASRAFSDQVDTGWTQENATKQEDGAVDLMHSDRKPL
jgi:hypothetical protein